MIFKKLKQICLRVSWPLRRRWRLLIARIGYFNLCRRGEAEFILPRWSDRMVTLGVGDGAWTVSQAALPTQPIVCSFGVGDDVSFDLGMIDKFDAIVHAFDPTPIAMEWLKTQSHPEAFQFHPLGIASFDGTQQFSLPANHSVSFCAAEATDEGAIACPVALWETIVKQIGLSHIDVLKIDIEGAEYDVLEDILNSSIPINQLLIEFHHRHLPEGFSKTQEAIIAIKKSGFRLCFVSTRGLEYSFTKK